MKGIEGSLGIYDILLAPNIESKLGENILTAKARPSWHNHPVHAAGNCIDHTAPLGIVL